MGMLTKIIHPDIFVFNQNNCQMTLFWQITER
jgi:hypothetical protein